MDNKLDKKEDKLAVFTPTPGMVIWLDTAIEIQSDSPSEISAACQPPIARQNWYEWVKVPGFEDWYYENYRKKRRRWLPTLDKIGMKRAQHDYSYWEAMNKKIGELEDKPTIAIQNNMSMEVTGDDGAEVEIK